MTGKVYFIGAGPGDPDLLTRKAWKILTSAQLILHDALVPQAILDLAAPGADVRDVGKRCGKKSISQQELHGLMIALATGGRDVVRLQAGDPLIFGRAGEEIEALREAGIEFAIVPGVTAASAAAAAAQISLTNRKIASRLVFLSGHRRPKGAAAIGTRSDSGYGKMPADPADTTFAIYMPGGNFEGIAADLLAAGLGQRAPCLIVSQASRGEQRILRLTLGELATAELPAPSLLIVGEVTRAEMNELAAAAAPKSAPSDRSR